MFVITCVYTHGYVCGVYTHMFVCTCVEVGLPIEPIPVSLPEETPDPLLTIGFHTSKDNFTVTD